GRDRRPRGVSRELEGTAVTTARAHPVACVALPLVGALVAASALAEVPYERIRGAAGEPAAWLTYSGGYAGQRFSPLDEIHAGNGAALRPAWVYQAKETGQVEATPLVADGVMYLTEGRGPVVALDVRTGRPLWRWDPKLPKDLRTLGFGPVNRGVALLDGTVYVGTLDAHLVALDA